MPSTNWAGTQYIQYREASVEPSWRATMWYSGCPSMGSLSTCRMELSGSFWVRSLVPIHTCSTSCLNVSLTFAPCLFSMPEMGVEGRGSCRPLCPGMASSGLPFSKTRLCCFFFCSDFEGTVDTWRTSLRLEPTTITLDVLLTPSCANVSLSLASPLIMTFIMAGGISIMGWRCAFRAAMSLLTSKQISYFFLLNTTLNSTKFSSASASGLASTPPAAAVFNAGILAGEPMLIDSVLLSSSSGFLGTSAFVQPPGLAAESAVSSGFVMTSRGDGQQDWGLNKTRLNGLWNRPAAFLCKS